MGRHLLREEHEKRLSLWYMGYSDRKIAKECGVKSQSIKHWRDRNNLPANYAIVETVTGRKYYER